MKTQRQSFLGWTSVLISTVTMVLASGLILYPEISSENILTALRFSSVTTAIPFLLIFVAKPLTGMTDELGRWLLDNRRYLWLTLTISHLIHLYQIFLYYQSGQSCPLTVWMVTTPLWIIMVFVSGIELLQPQNLDRLYRTNAPRTMSLIYGFGIWYIWLIFTLAFGSGAVAKHIPFYNIPAFVLFLGGAIVNRMTWWRRRVIT